MNGSRAIVAFVALAGILLITRRSSAQDSTPATASVPTVNETCSVERAVGFTEAEVAGVEDVLCGPIRASAPAARHRVRVAKLGAKVVVTLDNGTSSPKQLVLSSLEELSIAAPRLVEAAGEAQPVADTVDMTNVVGDEARTPKKASAEIHCLLGIVGASAVGQGIGAGVNMALTAGNERWSFVGDGRIAVEGTTKAPSESSASGEAQTRQESTFGYASLAGGARHHLSSKDMAPFVGAGLAFDYVSQKAAPGEQNGKTGLAAYGEVGLDVLRAAKFGGSAVLRADAPTFTVDAVTRDVSDPTKLRRTTSYAPIVSAGIAMRF